MLGIARRPVGLEQCAREEGADNKVSSTSERTLSGKLASPGDSSPVICSHEEGRGTS